MQLNSEEMYVSVSLLEASREIQYDLSDIDRGLYA